MSNIILIRNLSIDGIHGETAMYSKKPRTFSVDMEVFIDDISKAIETDNINHVFDYRYAVVAARRTIEGPPFHLIETLASRISDEILKHPKVQKIKLTLLKREFGDDFDSGITLEQMA